jgi:hypothetical protein
MIFEDLLEFIKVCEKLYGQMCAIIDNTNTVENKNAQGGQP